MKLIKIYSLFQIMVHSKDKNIKDRLHIMNGLSVHCLPKSKGLIDILHRTGLSISCVRARTSLSLYTLYSCLDRIPFPSHYDNSILTLGAIDNFDNNGTSISGKGGIYHTVSVLFQDASESYSFQKTKCYCI